MKVTCQLNDFYYVVVWILLVSACFDTLKKIMEVLISDREFFKDAVHLEEFESKVGKRVLLQGLAVSVSVEVPFVEIVHHLKNGSPLAHVHVQDRLEAFFFLFNLVGVLLLIFPVQLI